MAKRNLGEKIKLSTYDEMFGTDTLGHDDQKTEGQIINIPLSELHTFKDHPFRVLDDEKMEETVESIKAYGVLVPGLARPRTEGGYEIISGHRRRHASELAGKTEMPFMVRDYSDDEATIIMVDSNIQREDISISEEEVLEGMQQSIKDSCESTSQGLLIKIIKGMMNKESSYALLTSPNGDPGFATRISELFYRGCRPRLAQHMPGCTEKEKDAAYLFVAGGCGHLISAWMKEGMQTPPEEVADRLRKICSNFLEAYAQQK